MKELYEYPLDFSQTLAYLQDNLEGTNLLSTATFQHVPFEWGAFYTFFHRPVPPEKLYEFRYGKLAGCILDESIDLVFNELQSRRELFCIFDHFNATYQPDYKEAFFLKTGVHYNKEIYYVLSSADVSKEILRQCFNFSTTIWHSLCVLSASSIEIREDRSVTEGELIEFVKKAQLILVSAYDDEGFVFWKRHSL